MWSKIQKWFHEFRQYNTDAIEEEPSFFEATKGADREEQ